MILAAIDPTIITAMAAAILGGGFLTGIAIWRKSGPEAEQIVAATLIQVNEHLRKELELRDEEIERLRKRLTQLRADFNTLEDEFRALAQRTRSMPPPPAAPAS
jgi:uncharacterized protein YlxW (UPF0749 family)